jgi:predicted MPP superfamily phosphohydrolase
MLKARSYNPDIVVYTGDFISYESDKQLDDFKVFSKSLVKGNKASFAILGNHDYGINWSQEEVADEMVNILESAGIIVLRNEIFNIEGLEIIGLDDFWGPNFYPDEVMSRVNKEEDHLVLVHNPDVCDLPIWDNCKGWILSGHTHGGQVKPLFLPPPMLPVNNKRYSSGEIDLGENRTLYINRAIGHLWQVRLNVRPEITLFELSAKK